MDIQLSNHRIVREEKHGDFSEQLIVSSTYAFDFFQGDSYVLFYIKGTLNGNATTGGSFCYECLLTYHLGQLYELPDAETLVEIAYDKAPIDLEEMFVKYGIWIPQLPTDQLWVPYDRSRLRLLIGAEIAQRQQS